MKQRTGGFRPHATCSSVRTEKENTMSVYDFSARLGTGEERSLSAYRLMPVAMLAAARRTVARN